MSVEWFDLGARMRAASTGEVVPRLVHAPVAAPSHPVAVTVKGRGASAVFDVASQAGTDITDALGVLGTLAGHGVSVVADSPATLLVDSPGALAALAQVAREADPDCPVAAHVGWWLDRADFPGGVAVLDVTAACRARWVTGLPPEAERLAGVWREWLGVREAGSAGLLALGRIVSDGALLPEVTVLGEDDAFAFGAAAEGFGAGRDWRRADTTPRAAMGLRSRCDAADLYAGALLGDRLWRRRAVHTGHVVVGVGTARADDALKRVDVRSTRLDARVREGQEVAGWIGGVDRKGPVFSGRVDGTRVERGRLVLTLLDVRGTSGLTGVPVVLHERLAQVWSQRRQRASMRALYSARYSWLSTGRVPVVARRDVPLDVLVAGAEDEQ